jgi:hypothetical protein
MFAFNNGSREGSSYKKQSDSNPGRRNRNNWEETKNYRGTELDYTLSKYKSSISVIGHASEAA